MGSSYSLFLPLTIEKLAPITVKIRFVSSESFLLLLQRVAYGGCNSPGDKELPKFSGNPRFGRGAFGGGGISGHFP